MRQKKLTLRNKMTKGFAGVYILIILVIAALGGVYYFSKLGNTPVSQPQVSVFPAPQAQQVDETSNWKTYTNTTQGYTIKYPGNWTVKDNQNGTISIKSDNFKQNPNNHIEEQALEGASLLIHESLGPLPNIKEGDVIKGSDTVTDKKTSHVGKVVVDDKEALKWDFQAVGDTKFVGTEARILKGEKIYIIWMTFSEESYKETFDQILDTFKFTN